MKKIELFVGLKIPDTTAITAFHTLERMGYSKLESLERRDYYGFKIKGDADEFSREIVKTDILVNANKHTHQIKQEGDKIEKENKCEIYVLVKSIDNDANNLMFTLKHRLGFDNIIEMEKGILWKLDFNLNDYDEAKKLAEDIAKNLLVNSHYQGFKVNNF